MRREPPKTTANPLCTGAYSSAINTFLVYLIPECSADAVFDSGWPRLCSADTCVAGAVSSRGGCFSKLPVLILFWINITASSKSTWHVLNKGTVIFTLKGLSCYFFFKCMLCGLHRIWNTFFKPLLLVTANFTSQKEIFTELANCVTSLLLCGHYKNSKSYCV